MSSKQFVIKYSLYSLLSFLFCIGVSFTIAAWIIYFVMLAPFYLLCVLYIISVATTKRHSRVRLHKPSLLFSLSVQGMMVLASPASCYGWKQGQACYSLIQTLFFNIFTNENLSSFTTNVPHWSFVEAAFLGLVGLYIVGMILFLAKLRFEP